MAEDEKRDAPRKKPRDGIIRKRPTYEGIDPIEQVRLSVATGREYDEREHRARSDRKRVQRRKPDGTLANGGWRSNPNSLAALEVHRGATQTGGPGARTCAVCRALAVRGSDFCRHHGGAHALHRRQQADPLWRPKRHSLMRREIFRLLREGHVTRDMLQSPVFRAVLDQVRRGVSRQERPDLTRAERIAFYMDSAALLLDLIHGHRQTKEGNHNPWHAAIGRARNMGFR